MKIEIRMKTPLWTGGVDGTMDRIHETGIIGSLRWWYEAIVRGLGGEVCEGPGGAKCELSGERLKRYQQARENGKDWWQALDVAGICDACKVFGTTGWRRRFRLEVVDSTKPIWTPPDRMLNIRPPDRNRGWFLPPGRMGALTLHLDGDEKTLSLLAALFLFLERWGSIGAKPQLGYGVFSIENRDKVLEQAQGWDWNVVKGTTPPSGQPDLRRFGFFRYRFKPDRPGWWTQVPGIERVASTVQPLVSRYKTVPVAPALRNEWRFHRWRGSRGDEKWMFGTLQWRRDSETDRFHRQHPLHRPKSTLRWRRGSETDRLRSKVAVSWAYPQDGGWEVRGWVWLQKPKIADRVWDLIRDVAGWKAALRVGGMVEAYRIETSKEVLNLVEVQDD